MTFTEIIDDGSAPRVETFSSDRFVSFGSYGQISIAPAQVYQQWMQIDPAIHQTLKDIVTEVGLVNQRLDNLEKHLGIH